LGAWPNVRGLRRLRHGGGSAHKDECNRGDGDEPGDHGFVLCMAESFRLSAVQTR
jgi:hypothetical protein